MAIEFRGQNVLAYESREPEILLAGAAGTGKTVALALKCLTLLSKYPKCRGLFCRGTRTSLTQSGLVTWENLLHAAGMGKEAKRVARRVRQSYEFENGSEFVVAGLDDPGKTLSAEYDFVYIQEATEEGITLDVYETLLRSLRNPAMPWHQVMSDCNPTTPTHWLYRRQAAGKLRMYTSTHKDNPAFWDERTGDWTVAGRNYVLGTLMRMTGARRKRFFEGKWSAAEGLIYDGYAAEIHNHPPGWKPPATWARIWCIDWGFSNPCCLLMLAVDDDGRVHAYREFYKTHTRAEQLAKWAKAEVDAGRESLPVICVADHDPECVETWKTYFPECPIQMADKGDKDGGIEATQGRLDVAGDEKPRLYFVPDMRSHEPDENLEAAGKPTGLMEELAAYTWDTKNPDRLKDLPLDVNNHACDALRYGIRAVDQYVGARSVPAKRKHADPFSRLNPHTFR